MLEFIGAFHFHSLCLGLKRRRHFRSRSPLLFSFCSKAKSMARDRNLNVWQAYMVVMSIVSFLCIAMMIWMSLQKETNAKTVQGALDKAQAANDELRKASNARQILERIIGVGSPISESEFNQLITSIGADEKLNAAVKIYTQNMSLLGPNPTEPSYTKLVATLMTELRARNNQLDKSAAKEIETKDKYDATIAQETKARDAEKQKAQDLANQLERELTKYTENIALQQQTITKIETEKQTLVTSLNEKIKKKSGEFDKVSLEAVELRAKIEKLLRKLQEIQGEDFQYVQGKITEVSDGFDTVYINLGKADGVKPGITFGVLDADTSRVAEAKPKAKIEVIAVINENLSRCKVLDDRKRKIILRGDTIYSPAWQPGSIVSFALVGKMDIDGDGVDDRDTVRALIEQNGGKVAYELLPTGNSVGKLSIDTQWLVIGEEFKIKASDLDPTAASLDPAAANLAKKRSDLELEAKSFNIGRMNLDKLKGWLRGGNAGEVAPLGTGLRAKASDYRNSSEGYDNSGRVSELFQTRDGKLNKTAPKN
jgi:hypothetical protein